MVLGSLIVMLAMVMSLVDLVLRLYLIFPAARRPGPRLLDGLQRRGERRAAVHQAR